MKRLMGISPRLSTILVLAAFFAAPARADEADLAIALCEQAIARGAAENGVPQSVLHAISLTETGRMQNGRLRPWPWAINREGAGHWFESRAEALAFAAGSAAAGRRSFDTGCFQINYRWHGHNFVSLESMFDPDTGAAYAARFLRDLYHETGSWSAAAGAYHSRTPELADRYRARFDRILAGLDGTPLMVTAGAAPAEPELPRQSRTRITRRPLVISVAPDATVTRHGGGVADEASEVATADAGDVARNAWTAVSARNGPD